MKTFLTRENIDFIEKNFELPAYVYSENELKKSISAFLWVKSAFWHTVRFAMKANSNVSILSYFRKNWVKIDASSEFEVYRALNAGFKWEDIQLSGQEFPRNLEKIISENVFFVATSLNQLKKLWEYCLKTWKKLEIWVRLNPGLWSGAFKAIATGWVSSSFGIWHEKIPEILEISDAYDLKITKIHIHIGSENTPESWTSSADIWLDFVEKFKDAKVLDMWGGFKKAIMDYEKTADLEAIFEKVSERFEKFFEKTWRKIHLEVEPGKFMVINSGNLIAKVDDIVDTGENGYKFIKINSGMTDMPRVAMYGVQQPIDVISDEKIFEDYVVVGHCCESGDILTTKLYNQEEIETVKLPKANIWDTIVFSWVWAYNSSMSMKNYNSFPESWELFLKENWEIFEIRKREKLDEIWRNEVNIF